MSAPWEGALLDQMRIAADPLADDAIVAIMRSGRAGLDAARAALDRLRGNAAPVDWSGVPASVREALQHFLVESSALPPWADRAQLAHAERFFYDHGMLSVITLFGASLPACYVVPNLAEVLQIAGQLVDHTNHRVRETGRMIFPVMAPGGLTSPTGTGITQVQRVRLIHAAIRYDILHGNPTDAVAAVQSGGGWTVARTPGAVPLRCPMHQAMASHGWDVAVDGVPINQEELAYTLLTFSYVALGALRTLGLPITEADERAYLHCWNVAGHVLGIRRELMVESMADAATLFTTMQARGRRQPLPATGDPRPLLGRALVNAVEQSTPIAALKPFAVLMPRLLLGDETADLLGIDAHVGTGTRMLFALFLGVMRLIERVLRVIDRRASPLRMLHRILAYHVLKDLLELETRPLELPDGVLHPLTQAWAHDATQPAWLRPIERALTGLPVQPAARPVG
ncbi:MAG: DUF2236 domain-containing protein [Gemmatimonadaceae bacterium]|jgi:hypothetical protein|nr:DUF2236 domain-containing protein [Gemmatimonadaceae bacterium]